MTCSLSKLVRPCLHLVYIGLIVHQIVEVVIQFNLDFIYLGISQRQLVYACRIIKLVEYLLNLARSPSISLASVDLFLNHVCDFLDELVGESVRIVRATVH